MSKKAIIIKNEGRFIPDLNSHAIVCIAKDASALCAAVRSPKTRSIYHKIKHCSNIFFKFLPQSFSYACSAFFWNHFLPLHDHLQAIRAFCIYEVQLTVSK